MKACKYAIIGLGVLVLVGVHLPFIYVGSSSVAFADLAGAHIGEARIVDLHPAAILITLLLIGLGTMMGIWAHIRSGLARWQSFLAIMCFGAIVLRVKTAREYLAMDETLRVGYGQYVVLIAASAAVIVAIIGILKPDRRLG